MKTIMRTVLLAIIVIFITSCISKKVLIKPRTIVLPLGDTISLIEGSLIYGLPMTIFNVTVETVRTIEKPGPYAKFASEMLGIKDAIKQDNEDWSIKSIRVKSSEELDPSEFYVIESNTLVQTNALSLKKAGLIMDINPSLFESADEIISKENSETVESPLMDLGADEYYVTQSDTAYRLVRLDTSFIKIPYLVVKKKQLSIDELAEKAAKTLLELREGRHLIMTGEANVFPQNDAAIVEMNRLDREYTALFAGKTWTERRLFSYTLIPQKEMATKPMTLFRFSEQTGPAEIDAKTGTPVTVILTPARKTKDVTIVNRPTTGEEPLQKFDKLYYRIPDVVTVSIKMGNESFFNSRKLIYQFGQIVLLPANYIIGK
jgi:hypothetical protein